MSSSPEPERPNKKSRKGIKNKAKAEDDQTNVEWGETMEVANAPQLTDEHKDSIREEIHSYPLWNSQSNEEARQRLVRQQRVALGIYPPVWVKLADAAETDAYTEALMQYFDKYTGCRRDVKWRPVIEGERTDQYVDWMREHVLMPSNEVRFVRTTNEQKGKDEVADYLMKHGQMPGIEKQPNKKLPLQQGGEVVLPVQQHIVQTLPIEHQLPQTLPLQQQFGQELSLEQQFGQELSFEQQFFKVAPPAQQAGGMEPLEQQHGETVAIDFMAEFLQAGGMLEESPQQVFEEPVAPHGELYEQILSENYYGYGQALEMPGTLPQAPEMALGNDDLSGEFSNEDFLKAGFLNEEPLNEDDFEHDRME